MNENKTDSTKTKMTDELTYAEADVDRNLAKFSSAVDELSEKMNHTMAAVHRPKEKWLETKAYVTAPENRVAMFVGAVSVVVGLVAYKRLRNIYS